MSHLGKSAWWLAKATRGAALTAAFVLGACAATAVQTAANDDGAGPSAAAPASQPASNAATVVSLADAPTRQVGGGKAVIRFLARGKNAFLGKLEMAASGKVPEHRDATEEYIHVISGGGTIWIEDKPHTLAAGSTVYMPANAKVRYENGAQRLVALQVFAGPQPASKYNKWQPVANKSKSTPDQ